MKAIRARAALAVCVLASMVPFAVQAATPVGTRIEAVASADYQASDGTPMPEATSNSVSVLVTSATSVPIGTAKAMADGQFAQLDAAVVTAGSAEMGGAFYIEAQDRSAGIRVVGSQAVQRGDVVTIAGYLSTVSGERQIDAANTIIVSSGSALPGALGIPQSALVSGLDNTGLLVKVWGWVTYTGSGYFYVDDGSGLNDGSGYAGVCVLGTPPASGSGLVSVTGISGVEVSGNTPIRVIRTRTSADVVGL